MSSKRSAIISPSTTRTVIRFEESEHRYFMRLRDDTERELLGVTRALAIAGPRGEWGKDDQAAILGSKVHKMIAIYLRGRLDEKRLHPILAGFLVGVKAFLEEAKVRRWIAIEERVHCPAIGVAGTLDAIGSGSRRYNGTILIDWKSGSSVAQWMELQTAGYEYLARRIGLLDKRHLSRLVVRVTRKGEFKVYQHKRRSDVAGFAGMVSFAWWKIRTGQVPIWESEEEQPEGITWEQPQI